MLALLRRQILATDILTKQQKKKFSNNITSLASIIDAKGGISTNVITNSYPQFQLLLQQVEMIKLADDQQVSENLLSQISSRLSSAVAEAGKQGLAITNPQADLTTLNSDVLYGHALSSAIESSLQLNNVNSYDFRTYYAQSVTASRDINAAVNAAREVIGILQSS